MQQVIVPTSFKHTQKLMVRTALAMVVVFLVSIVLLALYWPLSREAVLKELEDESQSSVNIGAFHGTYFWGEPLG
jgi:low temperature requirement protein LtrA